MKPLSHIHRYLAAAVTALAIGACGSSPDEITLGFDDDSKEVLVSYTKGLEDGQTLHARLRRGEVSALDCATEFSAIERIDQRPYTVAKTWIGPQTNDAMFAPVYSTEWLETEPTPEMIQEAQLGGWFVDVCIMKGSAVVRQRSLDLKTALDRTNANGKADGEEERIVSTEAYAEKCVEELGEIPFFKKLADGDYETYNCLDSTPIPMTITDASGNVTKPETTQTKCDNPQYIYSSCEPNAVSGRTNGPRVASRKNDQGTHWVLLCRKAQETEGKYNDIAMIGTNPYTGKTCFFQNALYSRVDGLAVPHPGDKVESERSKAVSQTLWQGIHGGIGSGIECAKCHSADALIHTPWIDGALQANGDPVIPKMGISEDFALGYNDAPYSLINTKGQNWTMPRHIVDSRASACTQCHRIAVKDAEGNPERWSSDWNARLEGKDLSWKNITTDSHLAFKHTFWMPPDVDGLSAETWADSAYGKAMAFIKSCATGTDCQTAELPTAAISEEGQLPTIDLEGAELAKAALKVLGADVQDPSCPGGECLSMRCRECHAVGKTGLKHWGELTTKALNTCGLSKPADDMSADDAKAAVNCMRVRPEDETSVFEAAKLGVLTTGVQYTEFRKIFQKAYGDAWIVPYATFKARVNMPKGSHPKLSQKEYATLLKWFVNDMPNLDVLREAPAPTTCTESLNSAAISAHLTDMSVNGWRAVNEDNGIRMFGCTPGADPKTCFASGYPDRSATWGGGQGKVRELMKLDFKTSFWTRSSADGRFIGNGGSSGSDGRSTITDMQRKVNIGIKASYDPGFFPDNSGWIFQGATGGAGICTQNMLNTATKVDFTEAGCTTASGINLYQHVARGTNGGDYFVINSQFTSDSGRAQTDPRASFDANSTMKLTPLVFNGTIYEKQKEVVVDSPYEGDSVLSPSGKLVISRLAGPEGKSLGYVIRKVVTGKVGTSYTANIDTKVATLCEQGAKAGFSYDERFVVTHHYEGDRSNIILLDLTNGQRYKVTNMPAGKYAMFPHFRSDNWIYFLISDGTEEHMAASDLALVVQ